MKMEVEILVAVNEEEHIIEVELKGDDMGILIGKRGQTLDSHSVSDKSCNQQTFR